MLTHFWLSESILNSLKVKVVLLLVCSCCIFKSNAQLLDNSKGQAFTDIPYFNTQFVKASKIKEIKGEYTFKKQGDIMRESNFVYVFSFDSLGRLKRHYETAKGDLVTDTLVRFYTYNDKNELRSIRVNEKRGFMTTYFTRDSLSRIIKEEIWRDIDTLHSLLEPDIERSILWNSETMSYENYGDQFRKKVYNNYGNQYVGQTSYYDSLGYLNREEELFTITRNRLITKYFYANKGWIERIESYRNNDSLPFSEIRFTYDAYGNLQSKGVYKNGIFTTDYQVIYSSSTGLLSSVFVREVSSNFFSIVRFSEPLFWDDKPKDIPVLKEEIEE